MQERARLRKLEHEMDASVAEPARRAVTVAVAAAHNQRFWPACFHPVSSTFLAGASRTAWPASVCAGASAALISCSNAATVPSDTGT